MTSNVEQKTLSNAQNLFRTIPCVLIRKSNFLHSILPSVRSGLGGRHSMRNRQAQKSRLGKKISIRKA